MGTSIPINSIETIYNKYSAKQKKQRKFFKRKWIPAEELRPEDLLKNRPYYNYYPQPEDEILRTLLLEEKSVLVRGPPLSGKTRIIFEVLKSMGQSVDVIIPRPEEIDYGDYPFPGNAGVNTEVVILDDLDRFVEISNFERLLEIIRDKKLIIVATCQGGDKFDRMDNKLESETIFGKNIIDMGQITENRARDIAQNEGIKWEDTEFNGTVGSIFLKLHEMRNRYASLVNKEKNILKTIKKLQIAGIYEGNHLYPYDWVEIAFNARYPNSKIDWEGDLGALRSSELVSVPEENNLHVEDVYLENIVEFSSPQSEIIILKEMLNVFSRNFMVLLIIGNKAFLDFQIGKQHIDFAKVSIEASKKALNDSKLDYFSKKYGTIQFDQGVAYMVLALVENSEADFINAINAFKEALKVFEYNKLSIDFANTLQNLGNAYLGLSLFADEYENLLKAEIALKGALEIFEQHNMKNDCASVLLNLGTVSQRLANLQVQLQED